MYEIIWKRKSRHGLATIIRAHRVMGQGATDDDEDHPYRISEIRFFDKPTFFGQHNLKQFL